MGENAIVETEMTVDVTLDHTAFALAKARVYTGAMLTGPEADTRTL